MRMSEYKFVCPYLGVKGKTLLEFVCLKEIVCGRDYWQGLDRWCPIRDGECE